MRALYALNEERDRFRLDMSQHAADAKRLKSSKKHKNKMFLTNKSCTFNIVDSI